MSPALSWNEPGPISVRETWRTVPFTVDVALADTLQVPVQEPEMVTTPPDEDEEAVAVALAPRVGVMTESRAIAEAAKVAARLVIVHTLFMFGVGDTVTEPVNLTWTAILTENYSVESCHLVSEFRQTSHVSGSKAE